MTSKVQYYNQFRPLTGVEIEENKPLFFRIDKKTILEFKPQTAINIYNFWTAKDRVLDYIIEGKKDGQGGQVVIGFIAMIDLIWNMRENKTFIARFKYKRFKEFCLTNTDKLLSLFDDLVNYQTRIFFLAEMLQKLEMVQQTEYSKIHLEQCLTEKIPKKKHSLALQVSENWKKKKRSIKI